MVSKGEKMHASDMYLHSGKNCHFLHAQITSVRGWGKKLANLQLYLTITHNKYMSYGTRVLILVVMS